MRADTLGLDDDVDGVELRERLEAFFGVVFSDSAVDDGRSARLDRFPSVALTEQPADAVRAERDRG